MLIVGTVTTPPGSKDSREDRLAYPTCPSRRDHTILARGFGSIQPCTCVRMHTWYADVHSVRVMILENIIIGRLRSGVSKSVQMCALTSPARPQSAVRSISVGKIFAKAMLRSG